MNGTRAARRVHSILPLLGLLLLPTSAPAQGHDHGAPAGPQISPEKRKKLMALQGELQDLGQRLSAIQQKAMDKNGKLRTQGTKLQKMVEAAITKLGVNPRKTVEQLQAIQAKAQDKKLNDKQRRELMMQFMSKRQALEMAEKQALSSKPVVAAREAFRKKLEAAMISADPGARKLLQQFKKLTTKLQKLVDA